MAHTAKHKKEQKDKAEKKAQKDSVKAAEKKSAQEQFKKFLEEKGKEAKAKKKKPEGGKSKEKDAGSETKPQTVKGKKRPMKKKDAPEAPAKYDKVVLGGNKGDKSKTKPGKKDYEGAGKHHGPGSHHGAMKHGGKGYMDGFTYSRPAKKLGFIQKFGADRMSPGKMGDEVAAKMMHGDAAAKYYDGGAKYMNGMPKYEGASKAYGPMKYKDGPGAHKAGHIEGLPSYTTTNTNTTRSGGGSSSTSSKSSSSSSKPKLEKASGGGSGTSGKSKNEYMSGLIGSNKFKGRSGTEMAEAGYISKSNIGAYDDLRGSSSSSKSSSSSNKSSVQTDVKKKTNVIGKQTQGDVLKKGDEQLRNKINRNIAEKDQAMIKSQKDSIAYANKKIKEYTKYRPLDQRALDMAHRAGNYAGRTSLLKARGAEGEKLFNLSGANEAYNTGSGRPIMEGTGVGVKPNKKISKRNPEQKKQVGVQEPGYLGQRPMLEDYQGGTPKMPKGPMKFGMKK